MTCTHCHKEMSVYHGPSIMSSMEMDDPTEAAQLDGFSCVYCGHWQEPPAVVTEQKAAKPKRQGTSWAAQYAQIHDELSGKFNAIVAARRKGVEWEQVREQFNITCNVATLRKHIIRMNAERGTYCKAPTTGMRAIDIKSRRLIAEIMSRKADILALRTAGRSWLDVTNHLGLEANFKTVRKHMMEAA